MTGTPLELDELELDEVLELDDAELLDDELLELGATIPLDEELELEDDELLEVEALEVDELDVDALEARPLELDAELEDAPELEALELDVVGEGGADFLSPESLHAWNSRLTQSTPILKTLLLDCRSNIFQSPLSFVRSHFFQADFNGFASDGGQS
ncbi:MAG: hypothetical protein NVV73_19665 [Cellvibrionaceae bacterium]|nr:hypothetical protein [Cellvibrionaceae bacterium]